jgi:hypothetical protein
MLLLGGTLDTAVPIVSNATRPLDLESSKSVYRAAILRATHTHFATICDIANALFSIGFGVASWPGIGAAALVALYNQTCVPYAFPIDEVVRLCGLGAELALVLPLISLAARQTPRKRS